MIIAAVFIYNTKYYVPMDINVKWYDFHIVLIVLAHISFTVLTKKIKQCV